MAAVALGIAIATAGFWAYLDRGPTPEEFAVYAAFLSRLSAHAVADHLPDRFALADTSSKLLPSKDESWIPVALRSEGIAPPATFIEFCGHWCGRDFVRKNLREWHLKPSADRHFPFDIAPISGRISPVEGGKRVVMCTRPGFDLRHHRAVLGYSFDCSIGGSPRRAAVLCVQTGEVLLEKVDGGWKVSHCTGLVF